MKYRLLGKSGLRVSEAALAEATMDLIVLKPGMAKKYRDGGFEIYWRGSHGVIYCI